MQEGKRCSGAIPYGFYRKPDDKNTLYIDEEPAKVVRQIFQMVIAGYGVNQIADTLTAQKELIPSAYAKKNHPENDRSKGFRDPYRWSATAVSYILAKQEYMGHTILGKTICENYKTKKRRKARPEELMIFKNTHEAIVSEDTWHTAHRVKRKIKRTLANHSYSHRLSGMLYCADCGARMTYRSPEAQHRKDGKVYDSDSAFVCSTYRGKRPDKAECATMHFIKASTVEKLLLASVQGVLHQAKSNGSEFIATIQALSDATVEQSVRENKKALETATKRISELELLMKKLCEGNAIGKIPDQHFERMLTEYDQEYTALEGQVAQLDATIKEFVSPPERAKRFLNLVNRYQDIEELSITMINELIEKIVVYEASGGQGKKTHKIEVHFNFIGMVDIPPQAEQVA